MADTLVALVAAVVYGAISWRTGDVFPFSRYSMYARLRDRTEGAVLYVRAGEREVAFYRVTAWHGIDPEALAPFDVPCSLHWVAFEAQRWVREHSVATPDGLPDALEVGWRMLSVTEDGALQERLLPRAHGRGRVR